MATAAENISLGASKLQDENDKSLEEGIEEITLDEDDQPGTSGSGVTLFRQMPRVVMPAALSAKARYEVFSKQFRIADCKPSQVINRVHTHVEECLANRKWLALWRGGYDTSYRHSLDILLEVDDVCGDQAHVSLFDPLICSGPDIPQQVIEAQLEELDHTVDIIELYPVSLNETDYDEECDDDEGVELKEIASVIDNVRFFSEHLHRDWDDEDEGDQAFDSYLRARLQLYYDIATGCIPAPLVARYNRTMVKYIVRRKELLDYQTRIQNEGEPTNSEAVECWRKYYEVLMLSGLLQIWETLQLKAEGPCFPRVLRRTKGKREDGTTITHLVTKVLKPAMLRNFTDDTVFLQHKTPQSAFHQCFEGDTIILYPGTHSGEGFHELTESVTIRGVGDREDIVVEAIAFDDLFVNVSSATVALENITFVQAENTEGALRVESGHAVVTDCAFKCDGTGIVARDGAQLTMRNCKITGTRGGAIELMPGCTAVLVNNEIVHVNEREESASFLERDANANGSVRKGAVHLHVVEPPNVKMDGNKIRCEGGYGVTVGRRIYSSREFATVAGLAKTSDVDGGDARSFPQKGKEDLLKLGIEMTNNTIEEIPAADTA